MNNFWQRTLTGILFVAILVGATLLSEWSFLLLLFAINILGLWEYCNLFRAKEYAPHKNVVLIIGTVTFLVGLFTFLSLEAAKYGDAKLITAPVIFLPILFTLFIVELYNKQHSPFQRAGVGITGIIYIPLSLLCFVYVSNIAYNPFINIVSYFSQSSYMQNGHITFSNPTLPGVAFSYSQKYTGYLPLSCFILIWSSDTFAYLTGRSFGKHKLFPSVSPKKTWEGFIGGIIGTIGISVLLHYCFGIFSIPVWIGLALVIAVFGLWGDLIQSMLKRSLDLKDSGTILPGHGGILDRFDSLLFCIPFVAAYLYFVV
jgi:phosphatidate cytidylyltransferase